MYKDVKDYVRTCHECQVNKWPTTRPAGRAHVLPIPERPWQSIAIDFEGPLTVSQGYSAIMVVMDRFSGFLLCYPIKNKFSAVDVADTFMATFYGRYGLPESIVSDRDSRFTGKFWAALQKTLGIELLMATAFHQETNGQLERTNKTIMQTLRIFSNGTGMNWATNLWRVEHAHNFSQATWTNRTPFEMVYGRPPTEIPQQLPESDYPAVESYLDKLIVDQRVAHDALILARYRTAETVNKRRNPSISFKVGDYVLYQRRTLVRNKSRKLQSIWVGPFLVVAMNEATGNCKLDIPTHMRVHPWFATDKLKAYESRDGTHPPPSTEAGVQEEQEEEVDKILEYDSERNRYLVSWVGYPEEDNQWEPAEGLRNAQEKVAEYWNDRGEDTPIFDAFRKAVKLKSKKKRTDVHSRMMKYIPENYFYPEDDTDGADDQGYAR
jgi:transposase InsO family protein